jgi:tRNA-2-methylthio-N6-dimethylallyladenosine synthase
MEDAIPDEEKSRRLIYLQDRQKEIQKRNNQRHFNQSLEVMVEGKNEARGQWIGRTTQNKTLNFTTPDGIQPTVGSYVTVVITTPFPNSLLGQLVI